MLRKRLWTALLALMLITLCAPAFGEVKTGKIGSGSDYGESTANYTLEEVHGLLTISGGSFTWQQWIYSVEQHFGNGANVTKVVFNNTTMSDASPQFYDWPKLKEVDFSGLTVNSQGWENAFSGCSALETVNFNGVKGPSDTCIQSMFASCTSLKKVDLTGLDTSNVTDMSNMFVGCTALTTIDFGTSFDVSNVTDMLRMFGGCVNLTELDLSNWKTSNVTDMSEMFENCTNLRTIYVGDGWSTNKVQSSENMFLGATSIVGGMGTTYDANHVTSEYARADQGPTSSYPGYLTLHKKDYDESDITPPTPLNPTYNRAAQALISAGTCPAITQMVYSLTENGTYSTAIPTATDAGTYPVYYKVLGTVKYNEYGPKAVAAAIQKADPKPSLPTTKELTYNGTAQQLINGGITLAETPMLYSLDDQDYSDEVPTATDAGKYPVWYWIEETKNYKAVGPTKLDAEIKKADPKVTAPVALDLTYSGTFQTLVIPGSAEPGEMLYNGGVTTPPAQKDAGEYKVDYWVKQDKDHEKNYNGTQVKTITAKIEKDWPDYMPPQPLTLVYTGAAQTLAEVGWSEAGTTMLYRLKDTSSWDVEVPTGTNVGSYTLEYYVQGNANYKDQPVRSVVAQIVSQSEAEETKKEAEEAAKKVADSALNGTDAGNALTKALNGDDVGKQAAATTITNDLNRFYTSEEQKDLNLSAYDIEKAIANKEAEASDLKTEEANKAVQDATVPAATDLIANSDTASDALKDANANLSVQPKLVTPEVMGTESDDQVIGNLNGVDTLERSIDITSAATDLTVQAEKVEDLFSALSADLAGAENGKGAVIAMLFPEMKANVPGFFPLKVNLRHLMPGRKLKFWPSVERFRSGASGKASVAGVSLAVSEGDFFFLDETGKPVSTVSGDASQMTVVPYLTAGTYGDAFITVDATEADQSALEKLAASSDPNNPDNPGSPTSNKGSGGCDAGFAGFLGLTLLSSVVWLRKR